MVSLFTDVEPQFQRRRSGGGWLGWALLALALVCAIVVAFVPSPYVIEKPGPVFDTLGTVTIDGDDVPLIEIPIEETYPTTGSLDMLTVSILGDRENPRNWLEVATAWLDPSSAVVPVDEVYPVGVSTDESAEASRIQMEVSQQEAIAAALDRLDYDFTSTITIAGVVEDGVSDGSLEAGDVVESLNGETFRFVSQLRDAVIANGADSPLSITVTRAGEELTFDLTPQLVTNGTETTPAIGVYLGSEYTFPFDVTIQLENVGGPSAGQMFALGIIDKLTPESLNGGESVAGTGTISGDGEIGPIGGIRQKMYGAVNAGADYFLAPADNCDEVTDHIPSGLTVLAVETLDDSIAALEGISTGSVENLPSCPVG